MRDAGSKDRLPETPGSAGKGGMEWAGEKGSGVTQGKAWTAPDTDPQLRLRLLPRR